MLMHLDNVDAMNVLELDELRHTLRLSARQVCLRSGVNTATYQRWMRHARGQPGGSCPHPRTLAAVREALKTVMAGRDRGSPEITRPAA